MEEDTLPRGCEICCGPFRDPKVLPCFHIACRDCIKTLQVAKIENLKCPINKCSKTFRCENMDPESLPDAFVVYHFNDLRRFKEKIKKDEMICGTCIKNGKKNELAVASCDQCTYICQKCCKSHREEKKFTDHNVVLFNELSIQRDDGLHTEILKQTRSMSFIQQTRNRCEFHPSENCRCYCLDCRAFICPICIDEVHAEHNWKVFDKAAAECKRTVSESLPRVRLSRNQVLDALEAIKDQRCHVEDQQKVLSSSINAEFDRLMKILERRRQRLQSKLDDLTESKLNKLAEQQLNFERFAKEVKRMVTFTEASLANSTDHELLTLYPFLHDKIKEGTEKISKEELQPVETANTAFKSSARKEFTELCQRNLEIYSKQANASTCSIEGEDLKRVETMRKIQFMINVVNKNHKPCPSIQDVSVKLKSCESGFESNAFVHDGTMGRYRVEMYPEFRGEHEIHISVNGNAIAGSPYPVNIHMPPSQLGKPQGCLVDVTQPRGIALTPAGNILISEWNGKQIIEMDKLGRRLRALDIKNLLHPASIVLSDSNDIFIVEGSGVNCGIIKCSQHGKPLKAILGDGDAVCQFKNPRGVKISPRGNEVFVCDRDNHRIQVYDTDLNFCRCINFQKLDCDLKNKAKPNDLTFDEAGNMFVTDYANDCIHHLDPMENYVSSFSRSKDKQLAGPECLVVDNFGYLYVTESHNHRVSVFKTSGECITAFGSKGRSEGEFNFPMGIAIDKDGALFVCELMNNRIQIF